MVEIIKIGLRISFLTTAYSIAISSLSGILPDIILAFADLEYSSVIIGALSSAVSVLTWILGSFLMKAALTMLFLWPAAKLSIYFLQKVYYLGELSPSEQSIRSLTGAGDSKSEK